MIKGDDMIGRKMVCIAGEYFSMEGVIKDTYINDPLLYICRINLTGKKVALLRCEFVLIEEE